MENNPLDPSHELPAGNDDIMAGSIYEEMEAWSAQQQTQRTEQEAADQAAAEQQAIVDAAHAEAGESPRLSREERAHYRAIARAATSSELPEGIPEEVRLSTIGFRSTPAKAQANLDALRADARDHLNAHRRDVIAEKRATKSREAAEEAERQAEAQRKADAEEAQRKADQEAREAQLKAEEAERQAKLDAERKRVHEGHKASIAATPEEIDAEVEREINEKHSDLSDQSKNIMRSGLRDRIAREADELADKEAAQVAEERVAFVNANGGADAIDTIRAKEAKDIEDARVAEEARVQQEAQDADRQAFLDRLHGRAGNREAFRDAKDQQDAERNARTATPAEQFLANASEAELQALVGSDVDNLPDGLSRDLRRSLLPAHVGRNQAEANLNALRGNAQDRLNQAADARDALVSRAQNEGVDGLTDEEIASLPAEAMDGMSDDVRDAYFARMHQIRGAEHQAAGRGERNLVGVQSFAGEASELGADLADQRSLFPGQAPEQNGNQASDPDQEQRFSDLFDLELADRDEWSRQVDALSPEDRDAYFAYGLNRMRNEATGPIPLTPDNGARVWPNPNTAGNGIVPPSRPRSPISPAFPASPRRRPLGDTDPFAPMPVRARSGADRRDPSDIPPVVPEIESGRGPWPKGFGPKLGRTWDVVKDWWPGRSAQSYLPNTRPSAIRGSRRSIANGFRALGRSMNASPEMSDDERASSEAYIRDMDRRDDEEAAVRRTPPARARASRPRVNRPGGAPPSALDEL
jgi:hypothetical protein